MPLFYVMIQIKFKIVYDFDLLSEYFIYGEDNIIEIILPDTLNNKLLTVEINGTKYAFKRPAYAGNNIITLSQIYYAMGYTGTPGDTDRGKIYNAIHKMRKADIYFDNAQEAEKYKYTRFKYEGALLPCEIGEAVVNGKWTDKALHVFREPPLITFAKERKQITTLDIKLLQAPVSKTDANLLIQDYLLERISKARNGKSKNCRILFKTLFAHAGIATKKQQQRAPSKLEKYLKHYLQEGFIKRYQIEKDGITVYW